MKYRLLTGSLVAGLTMSSAPLAAALQEFPSARSTLRLEVFCAPTDARCLRNYALLPELAPGVEVARHTPEGRPDLARSYEFSMLPATAVLQDGRFVGAIVGARSGRAWRKEIKALVRAIDRGPLPSRTSLLEATHEGYFSTGKVFGLDLDYRSGLLELTRQRVFAGMPPKADVGARESYVVQLLGANGKVLYARPFDIPLMSLPAPQEPSAAHPEPLVHTDQQVSLILPYLPDAVTARVLRPYGVRALQVGLRESKEGAESIAPLREERANAIHTSGDETERLTILFMGDKYGTEAALRSDAAAAAATFLSTPPVDGRQNKINIFVDTTWDGLGCDLSQSCVSCNTSSVMAAAAGSGLAWDEIIVLVNTPNFFGCAGITPGGGGTSTYGRAYNGTLGSEVTTHELGHSIFGLMDEYVYSPPRTGPSFAPNCAESCIWGEGNCFLGCTNTNLYRRTQNHCVMNSTPPSLFVFGPACAPRARNVIDRYFVSPRTAALPATPRIGAPAGGATSAMATLVWTASRGALEYEVRVRDTTTQRVVFRRPYEGAAVCSSSTDRCRVALETALAPGTYRWFVRARNAGGESNWVSADFSVR